MKDRTLVDFLAECGWVAWPILAWTFVLLVVGGVLLFLRSSLRVRLMHSLLCFVPSCLGLVGFATGSMSAFETLGAEGMQGGGMIPALAELLQALWLGTTCSALAFGVSVVAWLVPEKKRVVVPELPASG